MNFSCLLISPPVPFYDYLFETCSFFFWLTLSTLITSSSSSAFPSLASQVLFTQPSFFSLMWTVSWFLMTVSLFGCFLLRMNQFLTEILLSFSDTLEWAEMFFSCLFAAEFLRLATGLKSSLVDLMLLLTEFMFLWAQHQNADILLNTKKQKFLTDQLTVKLHNRPLLMLNRPPMIRSKRQTPALWSRNADGDVRRKQRTYKKEITEKCSFLRSSEHLLINWIWLDYDFNELDSNWLESDCITEVPWDDICCDL